VEIEVVLWDDGGTILKDHPICNAAEHQRLRFSGLSTFGLPRMLGLMCRQPISW
jgi:hypothetical protein